MNHRLLVARLVIAQTLTCLMQSLTHPGNVAVAENAEATGKEALVYTIALDILNGEKLDQCLGHG
jgi:hypothetical protein